ncbi:MAG: hypothetical protein PHD05_00335 [Sphaerochaetaceae bacterium]|nr:hypothetical protein [Sphaerochaetaceae bacterium]
MDAQHWNDVLEYIKLNVGVPINLLEIPDDDLIGYLRRQVLTSFSQFAPAKVFTTVSSSNLINGGPGHPQYAYKIPVPDGTYIVDILEVMPTNDTSIVDTFGAALINASQAMDLVMANTYMDAIKSLQIRQTWEFIPPDILIFDSLITMCVVVYNTPHVVLNTIRPDLYHRAFKPLCLGHTKIWLASMRSKFENLSTPFGPLNLNFVELRNEGQTLIDNAQVILDTIPPDILIEVS